MIGIDVGIDADYYYVGSFVLCGGDVAETLNGNRQEHWA